LFPHSSKAKSLKSSYNPFLPNIFCLSLCSEGGKAGFDLLFDEDLRELLSEFDDVEEVGVAL